jgi:indole-3-glycerol phosphate synthase
MNILNKIIETKKEEVSILRRQYKLSFFEDMPLFSAPCISISDKLTADNNISVIAEVKKASPSKGLIRSDFDHSDIARQYMKSGADAISVLTDKNYFMGDIKFLNDIAQFKTVPLLRKEFIIDEYQIYEARANGADVVLLISEALDKNQIAELSHAAFEIGLEVLLELHSAKQLDKIDFSLNHLIGINNRNLDDFTADISTSVKLASILPEGTVVVSESGLNTEDDISTLKGKGISAVLAGEHFMRAETPGKELEIFKQWCRYEG